MSKQIESKQFRYYCDGGIPNKRHGKDCCYGSYKCIEVTKYVGQVMPEYKHHDQQWMNHKANIRTNNQAEFATLIVLLDHIIETHKPEDDVLIYMDSQVVLHSLWGIKKIKEAGLVPLHEQALALVNACTCKLSFDWISGEKMKSPDLLGH